MTREEAIFELRHHLVSTKNCVGAKDYIDALTMAIKALEQEPKTEWIPIKKRPLTDEEIEYYSDLGYPSEEISFIYDCPLPDDGQSVLISNRYNSVETDTFYRDDGCYFEDNYDEDDVLAWMPLPMPYKAESEVRNE